MNNSNDQILSIIIPLVIFLILYIPPLFFVFLAYKRKHKKFGLLILITTFFAVGWIPSIILLFLPPVNLEQPKKPIAPPPAIFADPQKLARFRTANNVALGVSIVILMSVWWVPVNASDLYVTIDIIVMGIGTLMLCGSLASMACIKKGYSPARGWVWGVCLPAVGFVWCWFRPDAEWKKAGIRPGEPTQFYLD